VKPDLLKQPSLTLLLVIIVVVAGLDQLTKQLVAAHLAYGEPLYLLPVLDFTLLHNYGAAFSFLSSAGGWQRWFFMGVSIVVSLFFFVWMVRLPVTVWLVRYSLAFIIAGAIGNLVDRVLLGYVIDFISVHWEHHHFPAFNVADSAITLGAMLMILDIFLHPENHK